MIEHLRGRDRKLEPLGWTHNARKVFDKLSESTQQEIRSIYSKCQRGYDDFASINRRMADFEEMLAWVHRAVPATGTPLH